MLPIGLQLYSVRNEMQNNFEGTLKKVAEMGYQGVEFAGLFGKSAEEIKELLKKYSLTPVSAHVSFSDMREDLDKVIKTYMEIGCQYIAIPHLGEDLRPAGAKHSETLKLIADIGEKCAKAGLTLMYHNHEFEFVKIGEKYGLDIMYETVPAQFLQTELDTCWVCVGGENPAEYIEKYSGRTPVVHLKDFAVKDSETSEFTGVKNNIIHVNKDNITLVPVGSGVLDFPSIIAAAEKSGAKWFIVEQDIPDENNTELSAAKKSIDYLLSIN